MYFNFQNIPSSDLNQLFESKVIGVDMEFEPYLLIQIAFRTSREDISVIVDDPRENPDLIQQCCFHSKLLYFFDFSQDGTKLQSLGFDLRDVEIIDLQQLIQEKFGLKKISLKQASQLFLGEHMKNFHDAKQSKEQFFSYAAYDAEITLRLGETAEDVQNVPYLSDSFGDGNLIRAIQSLSRSKFLIPIDSIVNETYNLGGMFQFLSSSKEYIRNFLFDNYSDKLVTYLANHKIYLDISEEDVEESIAELIRIFKPPKLSSEELSEILSQKQLRSIPFLKKYCWYKNGDVFYTLG